MSEVEPSAESAPSAAGLVRDFVNTVEWQRDEDSWQSPRDLAAWFSVHTGWNGRELVLSDLDLARRVREGLRSVLLMHAGHEPLAASVHDLNEALRLIPLQMSFDAGGAVGLSSSRGDAQPLALVLHGIETARADGSWTRLKACSRESCRWAYWDGSRNRSGRWCSMAGCGNYIKMRRRNGSRSPGDEETVGGAGGRVPTLVDVAGRAGVSIKTVSNVVTGAVNVADPTRSRVVAAIDELGYRPNLAARALATGRPLNAPPDGVDPRH